MANHPRSWISESIIIVVSILVAFTIDAWWQERQERHEERRILSSLRAEFQANADRLPGFIQNHRKAGEYGHELLSALNEAGLGGTLAVDDFRIAWITSHSSTDPQSGALDAILQSGELRYIQSQEVRERLSGWPQLVVDATENEDLLRKIWNPLFLGALAAHTNIAWLELFDAACREDHRLEQCRPPAMTIPYDTQLIGYLVPISGYSNEAARELALLETEAHAIVNLIDQELATLDPE